MRESIAQKNTVCSPQQKHLYSPHGPSESSKRRTLSSGFCARTEREREGAQKNKNATSRQTLDYRRASKQLWRFPIWRWHCSGNVLWMPLCVHSNVCYPSTAQLIYQSYSPATSCCESYQATVLAGESINYSPPCD